MYRLYKKNELNFSLVWIISYVVLFSVADSFSASLGTEKIIAAPVAIVFTLLLLVFVSKHNLKEKYGLCSFNGSLRNFLYFTPLLLIMSINLWNGVTMKLSVLETVLYIHLSIPFLLLPKHSIRLNTLFQKENSSYLHLLFLL